MHAPSSDEASHEPAGSDLAGGGRLLIGDAAAGAGPDDRPPLSTNADQSSQVRLHVGQRLGVATVHNAQSHAWTTGTSANSRIVHQDPEVTTEGCAPANAGCESEVQELYTATAVGDTDLTWSYQNLPSCSPAKDPRDPTPCVLGTMTVHVTVVK